jgi:hypothetical protein
MENDNDDDEYGNSSNDNTLTESARKNKRSAELFNDERQTDIDDIMSLITSKMDALTTASEDVSKDEIIAIFMQVLECTDGEAVFYLESTNWNIETAVQIKVEADDSQYYSKRGRLFFGTNQPYVDPVFRESSGPNKYVPRECNIEGLPDGWRAVVSRKTGTIYFVNDQLHIRQSQVPPGFADTPKSPSSSNNGQAAEMEDDDIPNNCSENNNPDQMSEEI